MRRLGRHSSRRTERLARRRHRPHREHAFVDRGHLRAVGRPHRPAAAARVDGQHGDRREPAIEVLGVRADRQNLIRAFAEPARQRRDFGERDPPAVGRPGRRAGLRQRVVDLGHRAGRDVENRNLRDAPHAGHVEERDPLAVRGPRRALRLRRQVRDLPRLSASHVADPELQVIAVAIRRLREHRAVRRPRRIGVERDRA